MQKEKQFEIIESHLKDNYYNLDDLKQKMVQRDLLSFAKKNREFFVAKVQEMQPNKNTILTEIYDILSQEPEIWVDLIISEFNRIKNLAETAKKREQKIISEPLTALTFFANQNFNGIEKLKATIMSGLSSKSESVVKVSLDLVADIYYSNKSKHSDCKLAIERLQNSRSAEIRELAKEVLNEATFESIQYTWANQSFYAGAIFGVGLIAIFYAYFVDLFDNSFIPFGYIAGVFLAGSLPLGLIHLPLFKKHYKKTYNSLSVAVGYGLIAVFLFVFLNFNFPQSEPKTEVFEISEKGQFSRGTSTNRNAEPRVWIDFVRENRIERMTFAGNKREKVQNSNFIKLETATGLFGFDVIKQRELTEQ